MLVAACSTFFTGCQVEDPGPRQFAERAFSIVDFDRLEIGSALHVEVEYAEFFSVKASGDRRNVEDLIVEKEGSTLVVGFRKSRERRHDTFITITSPELRAVTFSGASDTKVSGFESDEPFAVSLSGASVCQLSVDTREMDIVLSGASYLNLRGSGEVMDADLSGASVLKAFSFPVASADVRLAGASSSEVTVSDNLDVRASGASHLVYRGAPTVGSDLSGASSVSQE